MDRYPLLEINTSSILKNSEIIIDLCKSEGVDLAFVIKGYNGIPQLTEAMLNSGFKQIASSRIEQLKRLHSLNIKSDFLLLRLPMLSEVEDTIRYSDISLNSEKQTLIALNNEASRQDKVHKVILMLDVGDLREGVFDSDEFIKLSLFVERELEYIELHGVGTNLSCYGSVIPTKDNLTILSDIAEDIEELINRPLDIISGGATTTLPLLVRGGLPDKINHLRVGEGILVNQDLELFWDTKIEGMRKDTFTLKAEIIEINEKPTHPIGELSVNAFGDTPIYEDKGIRKRAILAIGNQDTGNVFKMIPRDKNIKILGASSDHTILDIHDCSREYILGDIIEFDVLYQAMLFTTQCNSVKKKVLKTELSTGIV